MPSALRPDHCSDCATRTSCVIGSLSPEDLHQLQPFVAKRSFQRGELLAAEGRRSRTVVFVKMGNVFGYRKGLDGRNRPIGIAGRGASFGLFGYFGQPNQASGVAASSGRYCEVPVPALRKVVEQNPEFLEKLVQSSVLGCGMIAAWSEAMRVPGIVNQLAYSMVLLADAQHSAVIELPTHTALGELLGATRETVARAFSTLEREGGLLRLERRKCEVHRKVLLARVASRTPPRETA